MMSSTGATVNAGATKAALTSKKWSATDEEDRNNARLLNASLPYAPPILNVPGGY
jgi:hypothetical protein